MITHPPNLPILKNYITNNFLYQPLFKAKKDVLLKVVDAKWIDHLTNVRMLQDSIGLRAYGQKDPLIEYKKECFDLFNKMMFEIQSETVQYLFRTRFGVQVVNPDDIDPDMMV